MATTASIRIGRSCAGDRVRSVLAGLFAGGIVGLIGAAASPALRNIADVGDRALINGVSIVGGSLVLWLLLGALHGVMQRDAVAARKAVLTATGGVAVAGIFLAFTALSGFADRLPSLAVPITVWVTLGGAAVFFGVISQPPAFPLRVLTPAVVLASMVAAVVIANVDATPKVRYSLSKLPASTASIASGATSSTSSAPPAGASTGASTTSSTRHFTVSSGSEAAFTVHEKLTQLPSPSDAIGKTQSITGVVYVDPGKGISATSPSTITVDLNSLATDSSMRDNFIKRQTLNTSQYPTATYTITSVDGFPTNYTEGTDVKITVNGTMTVHGVQQQVSWTGTARESGGQLEAVLSTDITMTQFGMTPPQVPVVQLVDDKVHLDLHLFMQEAA